jgi:predicted thioesterase
MTPQPGTTAAVSAEVTEADTATALGSGDVPVLATPRVVALMEQAAVAAIAGSLPPEATTVGIRIAVDHIAATAVGRAVTAVATVTGVEGRRIDFGVEVDEGGRVIARGTHTRVVVDRDTFLSGL